MQGDARQGHCVAQHGVATLGKGYEVNCCAVAEHSMAKRGRAMHRNGIAMHSIVTRCLARRRNGKEKR
nr:MAG TPA: hypothetical protein [Caudoviricetes sp.]